MESFFRVFKYIELAGESVTIYGVLDAWRGMQSRIVVNMLKSGLDVHQLLRSQLHQYASEKECYEARSTRGNGYEFDAESESESDESDDDGQHEGSEPLGKFPQTFWNHILTLGKARHEKK